jgi:tripartite-type tricarboxylate transporter receptor subunit TctC
MKRRQLTAAAVLAALLPGPGRAQAFPSKPIRIVVPFGAGGIADLTARVVAQKLGEGLRQSVIVDNKPGAGGIVAGEAVAKAIPDAQKDFAPVATLGFFDLAVLSAANSRFNSLPDALAYAKANPGKLNVATINIGSTQHLTAELLKISAGVDFQVVPFNGSPAVITALRGGQVDVAVEILEPCVRLR